MIIICPYNEKHIPYDLLLDADPEKSNVDNYLSLGILFGAYEDGKLIGVYIIIEKENHIFELVNLAVKEAHQKKGIGSILINHAENQAKLLGGKYMEIGTGFPLVPYYEKRGYIYHRTIKNFFVDNYSAPVIDNGILLKDMEVLRKEI